MTETCFKIECFAGAFGCASSRWFAAEAGPVRPPKPSSDKQPVAERSPAATPANRRIRGTPVQVGEAVIHRGGHRKGLPQSCAHGWGWQSHLGKPAAWPGQRPARPAPAGPRRGAPQPGRKRPAARKRLRLPCRSGVAAEEAPLEAVLSGAARARGASAPTLACAVRMRSGSVFFQ